MSVLSVPRWLPWLLQIFRFSIWEGLPLPGMSLMNLRFRNEAAVGREASGAGACASSSSSSSSGGVGSDSSSRRGGGGMRAAAYAGGGRSGVEGPPLSWAQRAAYGLGAVALRYAWARLSHLAAAQHWGDPAGAAWRQRCLVAMRRGESAYHLASLANFLAFLRWGRYRCGRAGATALTLHLTTMLAARLRCRLSLQLLQYGVRSICRGGQSRTPPSHLLACPSYPCPLSPHLPAHPVACRSVLERLLRARLVYRQPSAARSISFEYLNRQLVWSELRWAPLGGWMALHVCCSAWKPPGPQFVVGCDVIKSLSSDNVHTRSTLPALALPIAASCCSSCCRCSTCAPSSAPCAPTCPACPSSRPLPAPASGVQRLDRPSVAASAAQGRPPPAASAACLRSWRLMKRCLAATASATTASARSAWGTRSTAAPCALSVWRRCSGWCCGYPTAAVAGVMLQQVG